MLGGWGVGTAASEPAVSRYRRHLLADSSCFPSAENSWPACKSRAGRWLQKHQPAPVLSPRLSRQFETGCSLNSSRTCVELAWSCPGISFSVGGKAPSAAKWNPNSLPSAGQCPALLSQYRAAGFALSGEIRAAAAFSLYLLLFLFSILALQGPASKPGEAPWKLCGCTLLFGSGGMSAKAHLLKG